MDQAMDPAMDPALKQALAPVAKAIEDEFVAKPPTICVIGLSGVGKSSAINAMFGANKKVSATTRGTSRFSFRAFDNISRRVEGVDLKCRLQVVDAPGLGEDMALDDNYLQRYRKHLPKADVALWVLAARNRALALDQQYLEQLAGALPSLVIGVNQVDLVDPLDWDARINMPSREQEAAIEAIVKDRREKLGRFLGAAPPSVGFSAVKYYNLQKLYLACIQAAPQNRRWMFELLKSFSTYDWLDRAKGLSPEQKAALGQRYIASDAKLAIGDLPIATAQE